MNILTAVPIETKSFVTPDELLAMPDGKSYELIDGELVEKRVGAYSSLTAAEILFHMISYRRLQGGIAVFDSENGYRCNPERPNRLRRPDISAIRLDRLPGGKIPRGYLTIAPDLAVEVVSPTDLAGDLFGKLDEYRRVGIPLVWVVDPTHRTVLVVRGDGSARLLQESECLDGENVLPGFSCRVGDLFPYEQADEKTADSN